MELVNLLLKEEIIRKT